MPPRRSVRSAKGSGEPVHVELPNQSKRKRTQPIQNGVVPDEKENLAKPASRVGRSRSSAVPSTKGRASARSKLKDVQDSEDDDDDEVPPVKKARPSPEAEDLEQEAEVEEVKPRRGRKPAAAPVKKPSVSTRRAVKEEERDTDDVSDVKAVPRGRIVSQKSVAGNRMSTRPTRASAKPIKAEPIDSSGGEGMAVLREESSRVSSSSTEQSPSILAPAGGGQAEDDYEEPATAVRKAKPGAPSSKGRGRPSTPASQGVPDHSEVADSEPERVSASKSRRRPPTASESDEDAEAMADGLDAEDSVDTTETQENERLSLDSKPVIPVQPASQSQPVQEEPTGPKSRLVIHKMALINFKSYAGRQEIGPFHKSFSSIVGPNGSGKSNTIDALLFVFGYRASKMRQGKLSELIHNSARYPDLDECSVEVHFREIIDLPGPDAFTVVPKSQLVVARQAFKNNSSRYTINGRSSNYTEVQTLLKHKGIDLDHKRFLILQGEVESIAQMKPKAPSEHEDGLLEYLEDIIGTSKYKEPIEEALLEMDRLQEDRTEKLNRLRIVEREKNSLEDKKKEAEDYLRLQNEHVRALSRLWQWYLWKCLINDEEFQKKMARIEKELAEETEHNKDDITHLEMLEKHYKERGEAYKEVQAAAAEAVKDLAAHEKQEVGLEERRKHATGKAKKLKKSLQEDQNTLAEATRTITDSAAKMERERRKVEELEASLEREEKLLEKIRDSLKDKTQVFHDQIEVKQRELQPWTAKINTQQAEIDVATSERDALAKKALAVKQACVEAQEYLDKLQAEQQAKMAELEKLQGGKNGQQQELRSAQKRLQDTQGLVQELRGKASSARQKAEEAKASQAASTSQNKVLESLTKLRNAGRITGFHGRLGSLGTIPDKYDVAISTACGALNNLVVDTVEQGQACIEYLRQQNIGRASFMVLEKLSQSSGMEKIQTPENVPRLFDLIKPKEARFLPAFYKGIGNTLVADTLDQANRIAFGAQRRWRVVTLAGQLIDSSGTMSGGGTHVAKGGMSSKFAAEAVGPDVLRRYEKDSEDVTHRLEAALQDLRHIELKLDELSKSGPQIDMDLEKLNLDIKNGMRKISEAEKRVRDLKSQSKPDAGDIARISALEKEITLSTQKLGALQEKSGKIEEAIKELEKKILDIGGAKLLSQKSKVDGILLHINLANDEITKAEVAKAKAEKDSVKLRGTVEANGAAMKEVDAELAELNEQLEECAGYVRELRTKVEAAQAAAENSKDDLDNLKAELDTKTEEIQAFRQKEMELKQALNDTRKEAAENDRTLEHWRTEHDKLKLEEIDDDDEEPPANGDVKVKPEPGQEHLPHGGSRERTPSYELHIYSVEELSQFKKREMIADAELLDERLKNMKPNLSVLKEYRRREEEFLKRAKDLDDITGQRDAQKAKYDGLRKQRLDEFMAGFSLISMKLKEMYQMITLGGNAELELVDSMDPFSEGIIFSVMPPKKSWKNISNLSGGEKTLSSLALVFALHVFKPTPLYFMDEIDAALDFRNVSIVANYIKDRTKNAQFIIISLRNDMFELSHRLIGIYKTANQTRSISIDNHALPAIPVN